MNRAGVYLLGAVSHQQLIGMPSEDLVDDKYKDLIKNRTQRLSLGDDKLPSIELKLKRLDGKLVDAEVSSASISYHQIPHILTIIRDITERKKTQEKLRESEERLHRPPHLLRGMHHRHHRADQDRAVSSRAESSREGTETLEHRMGGHLP